MTEEIVIKIEGEEEEITPAAPVVVVVDTPSESSLSEADAIELAELRAEKSARLEAESAAALAMAEEALNRADLALQESVEDEVIEAPVEEPKEEPKEDTPPKREHAFFKKF